MLETLKDVQKDWEARLGKAASDRQSPMHVPAVATSDVDVRGMVLRAFDPVAAVLRFHTDARAPKVEAIKADPRVAVLLYDKPAKIQIRLRGHGEVLGEGALTDQAWAASDNFARRCYLGQAPSQTSDAPTSGLPERFEGIEPSDEDLIPGRPNFAILRIVIEEVDWFYLAHTGHMRAMFTRSDDGDWQGRWVTP